MNLRKVSLLLVLTFCLFLLVNGLVDAGTIPPSEMDKEDLSGLETFTYLPVIFNKYANIVSPIGVQMYNSTGSSSPYHAGLVESGTSWVRVQVSWSDVEPTRTSPPTYFWSTGDNAFAISREDMGGMNVIGTIRYIPNWAAAGPEQPIYPDRYDEFAQFVTALVERYDADGVDDAPGSPKVMYWELFNEPDRFNFWGESGAEFAELLKVVYPAVKSANASAQLVFPGIAYDFFDDQNGPFTRSFLTDVLDNGGGNYFDVMNFHSYPIFYTNWTTNKGPGLLEKGESIQALLASYNLTKPIIVTETGWHSNNPPATIPGSPEIQSRYVIQLMTQGYALDAKIVIWWMYYDIEGGYTYDNGLVTKEDPPDSTTPKQAYYIYKDYVETIGSASFIRKLTIAETGLAELEAYEFDDSLNSKRVFVAWLNPVTTSGTASLRLPVGQALVRNPIANLEYSVLDGNDGKTDGYISVQVGANPIYVEVNR
ncbi:MAG: hypothetical protein H6652_15270 [Ardenticatenaceae bacterium]|nr:hypothetical protein [Ardenticatenaceae bacterium]MCB8946924.1 hypothetical protein [Ardenticatenaceae bacterium]